MNVLNRIATANVDVAVGRCVYTQFLNAAAGIEADLTITRLAADRFLVITAAFTQTHVEAWIRNQTPAGALCVVTDLSEAYAMLNVQGPASRALLQSLSPDDFSAAAFPFATCREVRIGYQSALAIRLTYVGELGWELYIPTSFAQPVYDAAHRGGQDARTSALRLSHAQFAADREGLSRLAARHRAGGFAPRGRPGLHLRLDTNPGDSSVARRSSLNAMQDLRSGAWCSSSWKTPNP